LGSSEDRPLGPAQHGSGLTIRGMTGRTSRH
jgi:hypothetical protein